MPEMWYLPISAARLCMVVASEYHVTRETTQVTVGVAAAVTVGGGAADRGATRLARPEVVGGATVVRGVGRVVVVGATLVDVDVEVEAFDVVDGGPDVAVPRAPAAMATA